MPINEYKIKFTPVAEEDLDQIYEYIGNKLFAETAEVYLNGVYVQQI